MQFPRPSPTISGASRSNRCAVLGGRGSRAQHQQPSMFRPARRARSAAGPRHSRRARQPCAELQRASRRCRRALHTRSPSTGKTAPRSRRAGRLAWGLAHPMFQVKVATVVGGLSRRHKVSSPRARRFSRMAVERGSGPLRPWLVLDPRDRSSPSKASPRGSNGRSSDRSATAPSSRMTWRPSG